MMSGKKNFNWRRFMWPVGKKGLSLIEAAKYINDVKGLWNESVA